MQRIANGTQVSAKPALAAAIGTPGYGTNGDPAAGQESSIFGADEFNPIQEELLSIILAAGLTPNRNDWSQVLAALRAMFAPRSTYFAASGTYTVPAGVTRIRVRLWGAGGGGGGTYGGNSAASGGGAGGYAEGIFDVTPGQSFNATVGSGGASGDTNAGNGGSGGASGFGALLSAGGGVGGIGANGGVASTGGPGGTAVGGQFQVHGSGGGLGQTYSSGVLGGGFGGAAWCGTKAGPNIGVAAGHAGGSPGCGGSGGAIGGAGGRGADGLIIVEY
jgi:hypothetical protein